MLAAVQRDGVLVVQHGLEDEVFFVAEVQAYGVVADTQRGQEEEVSSIAGVKVNVEGASGPSAAGSSRWRSS